METNRILDEEMGLQNQPEDTSILRFSCLILLWLGMISCLFLGLFSDPLVLSGLVFLIVASVFSFYNFLLGAKITLAALLVGTFNLAQFFPLQLHVSFGVESSGLWMGIDILMIGFIILLYLTNKPIFGPWVKRIFKIDPNSREPIAEGRTKIEGFKSRFKDKPQKELESIAANQMLLEEARNAATELLHEKFSTLVAENESNSTTKKCIECGAPFNSEDSKMTELCPKCAHELYGYPIGEE
ncbi:MAG: hypothetical protein KDC24_04895 [Saprospiraceae bacterium]|nr:hypothetical protein [Saprospiraceae bacterium]